MKLLLDEMWSAEIAAQLRARGHDVQAVTESQDLRGQPDELVFLTAQRDSRVVVTENVVDYRPLAQQALRAGQHHPGLIFTSDRSFPRGNSRTAGRLVAALHDLLQAGQDLQDHEYWLL